MTVGSLCGVVSLAIQSLHDGSRWVLALRGALAGEPHHVQNIPEPDTKATQEHWMEMERQEKEDR